MLKGNVLFVMVGEMIFFKELPLVYLNDFYCDLESLERLV
jgi:hypothetical protein